MSKAGGGGDVSKAPTLKRFIILEHVSKLVADSLGDYSADMGNLNRMRKTRP